MNDLKDQLAQLSPAKRALFERIMQQKTPPSAQNASARTLPRRQQQSGIPLSYAQRRLWFLDRMGHTGHAYNMSMSLRLDGLLNAEALARSLDEIMRRHEALRTAFREVEGEPVQFILPPEGARLELVDLSALPPEEQTREAQRQAWEEGRAPFDLSAGRLLRARLVRLGRTSHLLLLTLHHIAGDGWSIGVLAREVSALYSAFVSGKPSPLEELPIQYGDFAVWQADWLNGDTLNRQLAWWREHLKGLTPLQLPLDHPRPPVETFRGRGQQLQLPEHLVSALQELSKHQGTTLFMLLLSAFNVLLWRYTGQQDIAVGSPIANRTRGETEPLIGFFANSLVFRNHVDGSLPFTRLLEQVRTRALSAYEHQDLPFERLVEELQPQRDLSANPLFQVVFALQQQEAMAPRFHLPGVDVHPVEALEVTTRFDLELHLWPSEGGLRGVCTYNADLFESSTIERLMGHFHTLLADIAAHPERRLSQLQLMTEAELQHVVHAFNTGAHARPQGCIHSTFEAQVAAAPNRIALVAGEKTLTYAQLDAQANRLAHHLRRYGVGPEIPVGLCLERGMEMVIAILGILKAGGAYVPLDPAYPQERLDVMLEQAAPLVILTDSRLEAKITLSWAQLVHLDALDELLVNEPSSPPHPRTEPDNLAYIMFTSGSTGEPRGVPVSHRNVVRLVKDTGFARFDATETFLQYASISFDASTLELWAPLLNGGRLALFPPGLASMEALGRFIVEHGITSLWLTASLFHLMAEEQSACFRGVRQLLAGGDVLSPRHVAQVLADNPSLTLINGYGPTENTTFTCCHPMRHPVQLEHTVPIGRPIANTRVYILDEALRPVPLGVPGELYAGGEGVARGYLKRPELTAWSFIPDPFSPIPGARLYRTGDLARAHPDGTFEFLGRTDRQVKLRGFRVEPAEIEAHLLAHPAVHQAAVVVREQPGGDKRLLAYVAADPELALSVEQRREIATSQVVEWSELFNGHIYEEASELEDPLFNTMGWLSTYDGKPIPLPEMHVWADGIVQQVLQARPRRVMEIGCGSGMLMFRISPHCEAYLGTDVSKVSLDSVRQRISEQGERFRHIQLEQRPADDFAGLEPASFDAIVLSSVVQYFPSLDYLLHVLENAVRLVRPGGAVYVCDVRSLALLEAFHASVELFKAEPELAVRELARRVEQALAQENELFLAPELFASLRERLARVTHSEVRIQRGRATNELHKFRVNAVLEVETPEPPALDIERVPGEHLTLEDLEDLLVPGRRGGLLITGLPRGVVQTEIQLARLLWDEDVLAGDVVELKERLSRLEGGLEPEDVRALCADRGYEVECLVSSDPSRFDAALVPRGGSLASVTRARVQHTRPLRSCANAPLHKRLAAETVPLLKQHLAGRLPAYMMPDTFVVMEALPLTPNEKVDHRALPAPEVRSANDKGHVAPTTEIEASIAAIMAKLLGLPQVSIHDNFFELGGHSLLATSLVSRIRTQLQTEFPLQRVFETPTVAGMAVYVENAHWAARARTAQPPHQERELGSI
ncbi:non-ribosomal peptide synthetase [Hyalangium versicolor]|uniref:non-ribosomal peptide synthetase n=1 Tax=Hyalangium versicolor TaxID=2861190 RepID=UPI001CC9776E|nr:non-ribosomal peptide synthetase [Hyalangium versicolor]